jgi:hypothetical protein
MLMRATFMPALASLWMVRELSLAGPMVQTILVWRKSRRVDADMAGAWHRRTARANFGP